MLMMMLVNIIADIMMHYVVKTADADDGGSDNEGGACACIGEGGRDGHETRNTVRMSMG